MVDSRYSVIRHLATGGMAEIFLAQQRGAGGFAKKVVVKRVRPEQVDNEDFVKMFLDEARIGALLNHRNVVQVFDFGEDEGTYFLAMEYLLGLDLSQLRKDATDQKKWLPVPVVASAIADACAGLHHAHTATDDAGQPLNLVHRDVSPSNLFVTFDGTIKVLDFGIAKADGRALETKTGVLKGKYFYMSPEQIRGEPLSGQSDVFALGACLYELLTCVRPFGRDGELAVIRAILQDEIVPPKAHRPDIPDALNAVVLRALARDTSQRFRDAAEMRDAIFDAMGPLSTSDLLRDYLVSLYGAAEIEARRQRDQTNSSTTTGQEALGAPLPVGPDAETVSSRSLPAAPASAPPRGRTARGAWLGAAAAVAMAAVFFGVWFGGLDKGVHDDTALRSEPSARDNAPLAPTAEANAVDSEAARALEASEDHKRVDVGRAPTPASERVAAPSSSEAQDGTPTEAQKADGHKATAPDGDAATAAKPATPAVKKATRRGTRRSVTPSGSQRRAARYGTVDVNCIPWCKIYVDGKDIGRNSPAKGIKLRVGTRTLRLVNPPSGKEQVRKVRVKADNNPMVTVRL